MIYIPCEKSQAIFEWIANKFIDVVFVNYEQVNMNDNFGRVMINNLKVNPVLESRNFTK